MSRLPKLPTRVLGKNGPQVPRIGLGLMGIASHYGPAPPDPERFAVLDKAYEMGETFWDTSDMYGDCETFLGKWFAANPDKRKDIFLATKFAFKFGSGDGTFVIDSSPEHCRQSIEASLTKLGVPYVDLYYVHHLDKVTPIEKTMQALVELKNAGKIKYIGLSECSAATLRRAYAVHPVSCIQMEYNPFTLDVESPKHGLLEAARELGVALVCYSPLGRGLLTGGIRSAGDVSKPGDMRVGIPRFSEENLSQNLVVVDTITTMAEAKSVSASQLTLAWLLAQGPDIFPIPGTTKAHRVAENVAAMNIELSSDEEKEIRKVAETVHGARLPDGIPNVNLFGDTPALDAE